MNCNFIWFNLPNKIKEVIAPYKEQLSEEANNVTWFNLPNKLKALCELVECEETGGRLKIIDLTN